MDDDPPRNSAPERDTARHSLTIRQASQLFAELGAPRAPRSVQRFCEHGYLDCVRVKGAKGDQFFVNQQSVERYAEELSQIEAIASIGAEGRHDAPQRDIARNSAPERAEVPETSVVPEPPREQDPSASDQINKQLRDENLNLRIDNRAKEIAIAQLNNRLAEDRDKFLGVMQDMSYKLGAAETRLAQIEAPKADDDAVRQTAPEPATQQSDATIMPAPPSAESALAEPISEPPPAPRKSFFGRIFG
jgi:hypothetical protein